MPNQNWAVHRPRRRTVVLRVHCGIRDRWMHVRNLIQSTPEVLATPHKPLTCCSLAYVELRHAKPFSMLWTLTVQSILGKTDAARRKKVKRGFEKRGYKYFHTCPRQSINQASTSEHLSHLITSIIRRTKPSLQDHRPRHHHHNHHHFPNHF